MNEFLSEESIDLHRAYVRKKRLEFSILESSIPKLSGAEFNKIKRMKLTSRDSRDALALTAEIRLHDIYFSSFGCSRYQRCGIPLRRYGGEAAFLNEIYRTALSQSHGFVCVYLFGDDVNLRASFDAESLLRIGEPTLVLDVCEHAYFMDYGFDKDRYLISALPYLDLSKLTIPTR